MVRSIHRRDQLIEEAKTGVSEADASASDPGDNSGLDHGEPSRTTSVAVWMIRISLLALPLLALAIILMQ